LRRFQSQIANRKSQIDDLQSFDLMLIKLLKAKIHHAVVTQTEVNYHGSITIDEDLLRATGLLPNEAVTVADCENGNRFETYIIPGAAGSGVIAINGAAARLSKVGNRVIVMSFARLTPDEATSHRSKVVILDERNKIVETVSHSTKLEGE
jgi:aspartate 1-decarboxylase